MSGGVPFEDFDQGSAPRLPLARLEARRLEWRAARCAEELAPPAQAREQISDRLRLSDGSRWKMDKKGALMRSISSVRARLSIPRSRSMRLDGTTSINLLRCG